MAEDRVRDSKVVERNLEKWILVFLFLLPLVPPLVYVPLFVSFIIWLRRGWHINPGQYLDPAHPNLYLLILILAAFLSAIFSDYRLESLGIFLLFLFFPLSYFMFYENARTLNRERLFLTLSLSMLMVSLLGLFLRMGWIDFSYHSKFINLTLRGEKYGIWSTLGHPNNMAAYLVMVIPLILISALGGNKRRWTLLIPSVCLATLALILTTSLGGILSFGLAIIALFLFRKRKMALLVLILILFVGMMQLDLVKEVIRRYSSMNERFYTWGCVSRMFKEHPLTGCGIGIYPRISLLYGDQEIILYGSPHNLYLRVLVELGLFGFIPFLMFLFTFFRRIVLHLQRYCFYSLDGIIAGCGFSLFGILLHGMVEDIIPIHHLGLLFFSILGIGVGLTECDTKVVCGSTERKPEEIKDQPS